MSNQVTGRAYIKWNGQLLKTERGARLMNMSGLQRNTVAGNEVFGYSEEPVAPSIEARVVHMADFSLDDLKNITNATVTFETDIGKTYAVYECWMENALDLSASDGMVDIKLTGKRCEEL